MDLALDTETYGLDWRRDTAWMVSVVCDDNTRITVDLRRSPDLTPIRRALAAADRVFMHNAKFDMHALDKLGLCEDGLWAKTYDTVVREYLLDEHRYTYRLDDLAYDRLGERKLDLVAETGVMPEHWCIVEHEAAKRYCERDALLTLRVAQSQEPLLREQDLLRVERLERETLEAVWYMEREGVRVDLGKATEAQRILRREMLALVQEVWSKHGRIELLSPQDLARGLRLKRKGSLFLTPDGQTVPCTPTGKPKLDVEALRALRGPLPEAAIRYRQLDKLASTFLGSHVLGSPVIRSSGAYVHPNINSTKGLSGRGTGTGRLSYDSPALQQIPSRNKQAAQLMKQLFLPDAGERWVYGDLDQNEFRVFAHFTGSDELVAQYRADAKTDFHSLVAEITGLPRSASRAGEANAKQVNLGLLFNMGAGLLAQQMGLPYTEKQGRLVAGDEVRAVLEQYHAAIPGVRQINRKCTQICEQFGYVYTPIGRRIRIPDPEFSYKAAGLLFQATAADNNKRNLVLLHRRLRELGEGRLLVNIHDEYSLSLPQTQVAQEWLRSVESEISDAGLRIPLSIEFAFGDNWYDATQA